MAKVLNNQYVNSKKYKTNGALDINTNLVRHNELGNIFKVLLFRMRNVAKTNYTINETKENRKPRIQFCGYSINGNDQNHINMCTSVNGSHFFNGIANCASYWRCPVCAVKISENKKELVKTIIDAHQYTGKRIGFLTLTIRHKKNETLKGVLDRLLDNYRRFQRQRFFSKRSVIGQIKTLEITYGENGWHPHLHVLYFYDHNDYFEIQSFQMDLISRWTKFRCNNSTLNGQNQQILTSDISDYIAKYDIAMEMTKGNIKGSKGLTPFTALAKIALKDYESIEEKRRLYGIYSNYVEQTFGRHYVNISNNLKTIYREKIDSLDKTDEQIVNETEIESIVLKISTRVWLKIAKNDLQPLFLTNFKEQGMDGIFNLISYFKDFNDIDVEYDKNEIPVLL